MNTFIAKVPRIASLSVILICTGMLGCQSGPSAISDGDVTAEAPTPETEVKVDQKAEGDDDEVVYGDLSPYTEIWPRQLERMVGPFEEAEMRQISGSEVLEILEGQREASQLQMSRGESSFTIADLLALPDAVGFHFVGKGEPLADVVVLFIPFPEDGGTLAQEYAKSGPGFMIQLGRANPSFDEEVPDAEANLERWTELDEELLGQLLENGDRFLIFQHMSGCGGAPRSNRILAGLDLPEDLPLYVDHDFEAVQAHFDDRRIRLPSSSLLLFEDGDWVDFQPGLGAPHQSKIDYLLRRNGYLEEGPTKPMVGVDSYPEDADMPMILTSNNYWTALNMSGVELQGIRIIHGALSGSDFSGADLQGATFTHTIIARTDFSGANFDGVTFENVTLREVVCVDGEVRSGPVEGCLVDL